jgi:dolichol kinase
MNSWNALRENFGRPEYVHALLNPLPVYGLAVSIVALIIALLTRKRPALVIALCLVLLSSLAACPTYIYGEAAYDRVSAMSDESGGKWLDEHETRAKHWIAVFYVLAGLAFVALIAPARWPSSSLPLANATLVMAIITLCIGVWIAYAGGRIRHKEFRVGNPPIVND